MKKKGSVGGFGLGRSVEVYPGMLGISGYFGYLYISYVYLKCWAYWVIFKTDPGKVSEKMSLPGIR